MAVRCSGGLWLLERCGCISQLRATLCIPRVRRRRAVQQAHAPAFGPCNERHCATEARLGHLYQRVSAEMRTRATDVDPGTAVTQLEEVLVHADGVSCHQPQRQRGRGGRQGAARCSCVGVRCCVGLCGCAGWCCRPGRAGARLRCAEHDQRNAETRADAAWPAVLHGTGV